MTKKNVFKKLLWACLLTPSVVVAQNEKTISAGESIAAYINESGIPMVWGNNQMQTGSNKVPGTLGTWTYAPYITHPTPVEYFTTNGLQATHISAGMSNTILTINCDNSVWAWGNNIYGQGGNAELGPAITDPSPVVVTGQSPLYGSRWAVNDKLTNVKAVYAAAQNSFAILDDGRLASWGNNSDTGPYASIGMLGDGTTISKSTPVLVKTSPNEFLQGVTQVTATDRVAFALSDPDGDGVGTVFSWGFAEQGELGRDAIDPTNSNKLVSQSSFAMPVRHASGRPLDNIVSISSGIIVAMALDANGYVWTWGGGAWDNGSGTGTFYSTSIPERVVKGNTTGASNDGTYLLAKHICGGYAFGVAITADNKPVVWGGSGICDLSSAAIGTGKNADINALPPSYVEYSSGNIHNDVTLITAGGKSAYYTRKNGSLWSWGCNEYGQLGLNNTSYRPYATQIMIPLGGIKPQPAYQRLNPIDTTLCYSRGVNVRIKSNFLLPSDMQDVPKEREYAINWYRNGILIAGNYDKESKTVVRDASGYINLEVSDTGTYTCEIFYVSPQPNPSCTGADTARMTCRVKAFKNSFEVLEGLSFEGDKAQVNVFSKSKLSPRYEWFASQESNTPIGISIGSKPTVIDANKLAPGLLNRNLWVEEKGYASSTVICKNQVCGAWTYTGDGSYRNTPPLILNQTGITIAEPVTIDSLTVIAKVSLFKQSNAKLDSLVTTLNFGIYAGEKLVFGYVADKDKLISKFSTTIKRYRGAKSTITDSVMTFRIPVNVTLPKPGVYFFSIAHDAFLTNVACSSNDYSVFLLTGTCTQTPLIDTLPGNNIVAFNHFCGDFTNANQSLKQGHFFDIAFHTTQQYCNRKKMSIREIYPLAYTNLESRFDGTTLESPSDVLECTPVNGATRFEWVFTPATGTDIKVIVSDTLSNKIIPGKGGVAFGTKYSVKVRPRLNGSWALFHNNRSINTPVAPLTRLGAYLHNQTLAMQDLVVCHKVKGATLYLYQFIDESTGKRFRHYNKGNSLRIADVDGIEYGHSYQVTVLPRFYNSLSTFSVGARIFTPAK